MNTIEDGICRTILATYHKVGTCNVFEHNFPAVMEVYESERDDRGLLVQGSVHTPMGGLYSNTSQEFFRGALPGLSRTLKCDDSACVCVEELIDNDMEKKNALTPDERKAIIKRVRIRKLTPKECLRLMGVSDMDIMKMRMYPYHELVKSPSYSKEEILTGMTEDEKRSLMQKGISNSQLYKLAGNSIVVNVLEGIFTQLFREDNECLF